jgi:quinol-cytochrome oxidoreductase complex cytochrome b subunit
VAIYQLFKAAFLPAMIAVKTILHIYADNEQQSSVVVDVDNKQEELKFWVLCTPSCFSFR